MGLIFENKNQSFLLIISFIVVAFYCTGIFSEGMFLDGLMYADVSRNLADGDGSFWDMLYTHTKFDHFHEQPPFAFFLQSFFYSIIGDHIFVEHLYSFLFLLGWIFIFNKLCKFIFAEIEFAFFSIILLLIIPIIQWTFRNNVLEITMGFFSLCAVYFSIKGIEGKNKTFILLASLFLFLASFSKGIQALFPLVVPFFYFILHKEYRLKYFIQDQLILLSFPILIYTSFYFYEPAYNSYYSYFQSRLVGTFAHKQNTTSFRGLTIRNIIEELLLPIILCVGFFITSKNKKINFSKKSLLFLLIGLSASLPLMVTLEQRRFYISPSIPYFVLSIAILFYPFFKEKVIKWNEKKWDFKILNSILIILISIVSILVFFQVFSPSRDKELISDLKKLKQKLPPKTILSTQKDVFDVYENHAYFQRYRKLSLIDTLGHEFCIVKKNSKIIAQKEKYILQKDTFFLFDLYKKSN
ncbi:MAG: glycosyltransferase family 39 protein [Chitinophagaceae bacterium]|nr:glycosyltransferase family 39 protein [Chitinophagaceae bacterium]